MILVKNTVGGPLKRSSIGGAGADMFVVDGNALFGAVDIFADMGDNNDEVMHDVFPADWSDRNPMPGSPQGIEGVRQFVRKVRSAFPDAQLGIDQIIADPEEHLVAFRFIARATHRGQFFGIAPTRRRVEFTGITIHRVENGKFVESSNEIDFHGLLSQLRDNR